MSWTFYKYDIHSAVGFISNQINSVYPAQWFVCVITSYRVAYVPVPNKDFGISSSSKDGNSWLYARNLNHYWP